MSGLEWLAIVSVIDFTAIGALVLVLQHLKTMRATDGELTDLRADLARELAASGVRIDRAFSSMADLDTRLIHLSNRTQR